MSTIETLPTLTGSEKQIAWAATIRRDALALLAACETEELASRAEWERDGGESETLRALRDQKFARIAEARTRIAAATAAAAIIDARLVLGGIKSYLNSGLPRRFCAALPLPV